MRAALAAGEYEALTIEGLAGEAEVSKQTIYRWWPSKAAILGEALLEGELPGADASVPTTSDLEADLRAWFSLVSRSLGSPESVAVARALIAVTATDAALGAVLNEKLAAPVREWVVARLRVAVSAGDVRADVDAEAVAEHFVALASYAALLGTPLGEERVAAMVGVVMRGIAAR